MTGKGRGGMDNSDWGPIKHYSDKYPVPARHTDGRWTTSTTTTTSTYGPWVTPSSRACYDRRGEMISREKFAELRLNPNYVRVASDTTAGGLHVYTSWEGTHPTGMKVVDGRQLIYKTVLFETGDASDVVYVVYSSTEEDALNAHRRAQRFASLSTMVDDDEEEGDEDD